MAKIQSVKLFNTNLGTIRAGLQICDCNNNPKYSQSIIFEGDFIFRILRY